MKKSLLLSIALVCLFAVEAKAQSGQGSDTACVGLKNPTNFTMSGGHNELWTGYTGTKQGIATSCTGEGGTFNVTVQAADLASYNNTNGCTSVSYEGAANTTSRDVNNQLDYSRQFVIKGAGTDPETHGRLSYLPTEYDSTIVRSIRLGNYCGNAGAEKLTYDIDVSADNALLTIYYALSLQNGLHSGAQNPEFTILIQKQQGSDWVPVDCQKLSYFRPTPASGQPQTPFLTGATGLSSGCQSGKNLYLPWQKVLINLYDYMYQRIRIKITAGDCSMTVHYALCYIAGDCQPMKLITSGCAAGESNAVTTIKAPKGAISYQWYRSKTGKLTGESRESDNSYVAIDGATDDSLGCTADHFRPIGLDTMYAQTTFMCKITTKMNENYPIVSKLYADVSNTKPYIVVDSALDCGAGITMSNHSYSPVNPGNSDLIDQDATQWLFYSTENPTDQTLEGTYTGPTAHHTFSTPGTYSVKVRTYLADDSTCWNEKPVKIRVIKSPVPRVMVQRNDLCEGDTITIQDQTTGSQFHEWQLSYPDTTYTTTMPVTQRIFDTTTTVRLRTRSAAHFMADTTGDGIVEQVYCYSDTSFVIRVQPYPILTVMGDTIVCNGDQSNVTVGCDNVEMQSYDWYQILNGTTPVVANNSNLVTTISEDRRYYVKATTTYGCISWDSINLYLVKPSLEVDRDKICSGDTATLTAGRAAYFEWTSTPPDPALVGHDTDTAIIVSPEVTTTYSVIGHGTNGCGATALTHKINVYPYPVQQWQLTPDYIDSENPSVQFSDLSEYGTSSLWDFGGGNTSTIRTVVFTFTDLSQDSLEIKLRTYNAIGCYSDTSFFVPVGIFAVWFPNAFTPKLETNNFFKPFTANTLQDYELHIFDRGGNLVFTTTDIEEGWDGTYKGHDCPQGSYVYIATYRRQGVERLMSQKGTVTLLR